MIYLDNGATSFHKPRIVWQAVQRAMQTCGNPGRGGYRQSVEAARVVGNCREKVSRMFDCLPEQVVFTGNCTQGLNMAIRTLVKPGSRVLISGFEHNAVTRPLYAQGAKILVAGRKLFDWDDTLEAFEKVLRQGVDAAVFTHVSNVFGYILPVEEMARLCRNYGVSFVIDAAQSAGVLPVHLSRLGAAFIAAPGHKGLLGPQGTGILLCGQMPETLIQGGTGSLSESWEMPDFLPDRGEAGTLNVPGIAGLGAGISYLTDTTVERIAREEARQAALCATRLKEMGLRVFTGPHQSGTVSFVPRDDCEEFAQKLAGHGVAVRAGLHCAPLAHESADTLNTGTVRVSFGHDASRRQTENFLQVMEKLVLHK